MIEREHIGIFGKMNSGKSTLMNLLTQQETSITDSTPGTTADTKVAMQELHGLGPVKLFDTAGLDELSGLGVKKRNKVLNVLKECDLVLLIINPASKDFSTEKEILGLSRELNKQLLLVYNIFNENDVNKISGLEHALPLIKFYRAITIRAVDVQFRHQLIEFLIKNYDSEKVETELLPFIEKDGFYILNIPMDEETPQGRFLRPQAMAVEYITRNMAYAVTYRMDLAKARSTDKDDEKKRFDDFLNNFKHRPKVIITDSQAMDIMAHWTPPDIDLTTFSIMMINHVSKGRIDDFYKGIETMDNVKSGDKILIAEACNHSRINEDIGTVQIPELIKKKYPGVEVEFNFGREFQENESLQAYKLIIHCGGCMISNQKLQARLRDLRNVDVPVTNYGVFLSWMQGDKALKRVMKPWIG
jgi:[FeFe] hydrogenase H-cluster maturation GTPase HydF